MQSLIAFQIIIRLKAALARYRLSLPMWSKYSYGFPMVIFQQLATILPRSPPVEERRTRTRRRNPTCHWRIRMNEKALRSLIDHGGVKQLQIIADGSNRR